MMLLRLWLQHEHERPVLEDLVIEDHPRSKICLMLNLLSKPIQLNIYAVIKSHDKAKIILER